jgi:type II secretory pathway pseudopilin PulG
MNKIKTIAIVATVALTVAGLFLYLKNKGNKNNASSQSNSVLNNVLPTSDTLNNTSSGNTSNSNTSNNNTSNSNTNTTNTSQLNQSTSNQASTNTGTGNSNATSQSTTVSNTVTTEVSPASLSNLQAVIYLNKYTDLKNAFGSNIQQAKEHWVKLGKSEGRTIPLVKNSIGSPSELSDDQAIIYLSKYLDLLNAFGVNLQLAKQHWVNLGKSEGRTIDIVV